MKKNKYKGKTFAEIAKMIQKESEDRPNDPISKKTLDDMMGRLRDAQEEYKALKEERKLAKALDSMSTEDKAILMNSLMQQQEGIDLSQPMYAEGGKIHIKPSKKGTFTAAATKHGKSVQEFASQVLANKENYSPAMVKKANFARNAAHWHALGDYLNTENLRYMPALGSLIGAGAAALQPEDFRLANELDNIATLYKPMAAAPIGGKRQAKQYDVNLGDAENLAMQAAALRANRSNANRGQQTASAIGIINAFEKQNALRNLEWQRMNEAADLETAKYNLGIDQFNAQQAAAYDKLNADILNLRNNMYMRAAEARDASRTARANMINTTMTNAFNQLGNVGQDTWNYNELQKLFERLGYDKEAIAAIAGRYYGDKD